MDSTVIQRIRQRKIVQWTLAMGRYESAAARLPEIPFDPMVTFLIRHVEWWAELGALPAGRMYIDDMERNNVSQLQRLRETGIPWLLEPEQWTHPAQRFE